MKRRYKRRGERREEAGKILDNCCGEREGPFE